MALIGSSGQFGGGMLNPASTIGGRAVDQYGVPMIAATTTKTNPWDAQLAALLAQLKKPGSVAGNWDKANSLLDRATGITPSWANVNPQQIGMSTIADPRAAINATLPGLREAASKGFATAGGRLGQSGFSMSTPYAADVAGVARKQANDLAATTQQMQYDAAKTRAANALDAAKANQGSALSAGIANSQGGLTAQEDLQRALLTGAGTAGGFASDITNADANANNSWLANAMSLYGSGNNAWLNDPNNAPTTNYTTTDPSAEAELYGYDIENKRGEAANRVALTNYVGQHQLGDYDVSRRNTNARDDLETQRQQFQLDLEKHKAEMSETEYQSYLAWIKNYGGTGAKPPWWRD